MNTKKNTKSCLENDIQDYMNRNVRYFVQVVAKVQRLNLTVKTTFNVVGLYWSKMGCLNTDDIKHQLVVFSKSYGL